MSDAERPLAPRPNWDADFPVDRVEAQHVGRREFAKFLVVVSGGLCVGSGWIAVKDRLFRAPEPGGVVPVCAVSELPVGGMRGFRVPGFATPYIVIRVDEVTFRAYEQKCTHLSCAVIYAPETKRIECPCHNGAFDPRTGEVLAGPPPRPLRAVPVEVREGQVVALFGAGSPRTT